MREGFPVGAMRFVADYIRAAVEDEDVLGKVQVSASNATLQAWLICRA